MAREGFSGGKCLLYSIELLFKKNPNSNLLFQSYFPFFHLASTDFTYVLFTCNATFFFLKTKCYPSFQIQPNFSSYTHIKWKK